MGHCQQPSQLDLHIVSLQLSNILASKIVRFPFEKILFEFHGTRGHGDQYIQIKVSEEDLKQKTHIFLNWKNLIFTPKRYFLIFSPSNVIFFCGLR